MRNHHSNHTQNLKNNPLFKNFDENFEINPSKISPFSCKSLFITKMSESWKNYICFWKRECKVESSKISFQVGNLWTNLETIKMEFVTGKCVQFKEWTFQLHNGFSNRKISNFSIFFNFSLQLNLSLFKRFFYVISQ